MGKKLRWRPRQGEKTRLKKIRSEEHTSELQSRQYLVCRLLLEKKNSCNHSTRSWPAHGCAPPSPFPSTTATTKPTSHGSSAAAGPPSTCPFLSSRLSVLRFRFS